MNASSLNLKNKIIQGSPIIADNPHDA